MKNYVVDERTLRYLLYCEMQVYMLETDGVDNWSWYGESFKDTKREFYPGNWDELSECERVETDFQDIAQLRLDTGEFRELVSFGED